jgi:hypothetical protein
MLYVSKHLPLPPGKVQPTVECVHAGHVYHIEQGLLMALYRSKAITASIMHSASVKMQKMKNCRAQPTKGTDLFVAKEVR